MSDPEPPALEYPCVWVYKAIGRDETAMRAAIGVVFAQADCTIAAGRSSHGGKYVSLRVELQVQSETQRNTFFTGLRDHPDIVFVL